MSSNGSVGGSSVASMERMVIKRYDEEDVDGEDGEVTKHTGYFQYNPLIERFCWSCCINEDRNARGCIDDQSVGVLSALAEKPHAFYKPSTKKGRYWKDGLFVVFFVFFFLLTQSVSYIVFIVLSTPHSFFSDHSIFNSITLFFFSFSQELLRNPTSSH